MCAIQEEACFSPGGLGLAGLLSQTAESAPPTGGGRSDVGNARGRLRPSFCVSDQEVDAIAARNEVRINDRIRVPMVRVIGPEGDQLGVMAISDALRLARDMTLDLVEVAPAARPPVCRVMDFGKYKYEQAKREQKAKKKQRVTVVKEVKLRPKVEKHDFEFKMRNARRFLEERDKVKIVVQFRGRELSHPELGRELIDKVIETLDDVGTVEQTPSLEGRVMVMMLAPRPAVVAKKPPRQEQPEARAPHVAGEK